MEEIKQKIQNEYKDITIDNFSYENEYIKMFKFRKSDIKMKLVKFALEYIDRKESINKINEYVKYEYISSEIEKGIFEFALIEVSINNYSNNYVIEIYLHKLNDICINLDITNNNINNYTLLPSILEMRIKPSRIAFIPPEQLHPLRFKDVLEKINLKEKTMNSLQTTDMYQCKKCKERKFKISTMQTRCADEPETKFLTCLVCYFTFTI